MTIDAAEIVKLREEADADGVFMAPTMLALLDELEKARAERDAAHALLRKMAPALEANVRARIDKLLGDA